ncbi:MAG: hypothetical protein H8E46_08560 [FCB group bacterium]|nr:hypothetical protein [FCB group bacterium]
MVIIISTLLVLLSSLLTLAQPQTIPLTLEWQYDFGDLAYNSIVCDPDEDGIPDVFCRLIGNTLVRLSDGNEIWRTDDLGYSISTMSILDTNGDGVMSLVTAPDPDNYDNIVREYNIETGDLIAESPVLDTRQIYSLNSYTDSTDSTVYIVAGTGGSEVRDLLVFWVHYTQGNVIRLCPDDLTIIDSLHYAVEDSERYAELHTYYSSESNNEMIFYRQYGSEYIWGMSERSIKPGLILG